MYKCAKTLMYLIFIVVVPALLSACGGSATEGTDSQTNNTVNKTEEASSSSTNSSVKPSSSLLSSSSSIAPSSQAQSSVGIDVTPPTTTQLQLYRISENTITLIWDDATDDVGISHYELARNGEFVAKIEYPFYKLLDQGLTPYTTYRYTITTVDLTGNASDASEIFTVRTLATSGAISSSGSSSDNSLSSANTNSSSDQSSNNLSSSSESDGSLSSASPDSSSNPSASSASNSSLASGSSDSSHSLSASSNSNSSQSNPISSKSSASSVASLAATLSWSHPNQRENGKFLELDEIAGYEIRYRKPTGTRYTYITLYGNRTTEYTFPEDMQIHAQDLEFEIAVFDTKGLYSQFVKVRQ
jgi:hypothetical protein